MDNSTQRTELIMMYLDGEMSRAEKDEFEKNLAADKSMQQELEDMKMASDAVKMFGLKQQVASVRREMLEQERPQGIVRKMNTTRRIVRYSLSAAAGILLIAISILAYHFFSLSPDKLYGEKYISFEPSTLRDGSLQSMDPIEKAYRNHDYHEAIHMSSETPSLSAKDRFLLGMSCMELNKPTEAIGYFSTTIALDKNLSNPVYKDEAEYYLALSYLKTRNYDKALELMNTIHENPSHLYHDKFTRGFIRDVKLLKMR